MEAGSVRRSLDDKIPRLRFPPEADVPRAGIRASRRAYRCANFPYNRCVQIFKPMTTNRDPGRP